MADSIWYLVGHFEGGINRGLPYACLDGSGGLDAYCLRMHTASECIRLPNAFGRRMHSAADAFGGSMHSEAVCIRRQYASRQ